MAVRDRALRYVEYDGGKGGAMLFDERPTRTRRRTWPTTRSLRRFADELAGLAKKTDEDRQAVLQMI